MINKINKKVKATSKQKTILNKDGGFNMASEKILNEIQKLENKLNK